MRAGWLAVCLGLGFWMFGAGVAPGSARARREEQFRYPYVRVWTAAVQLLRVELDCPITEKDRDEGYFLFEYADHGKTYPGSVQIVSTKADGQENVRVVIQVAAMPSYVEAAMLDRLSRKLVAEFGAPKEKAPTPPPSPAKPGAQPGTATQPDSATPRPPGTAPAENAPASGTSRKPSS